MLLLSIVVAVVVAIAAFAAAAMLDDEIFEVEGQKINTSAGVCYLAGSIGLGLTVGLINYFTPRIASVLWLAPVFLAVMAGLTVGLVVWWCRDGSSLKEMIPVLILLGLFAFVTRAAAVATTALWVSSFWDSLLIAFSWILMVASLGVIVLNWAYFRFVVMGDDGDSECDGNEDEDEDEDE